MRRILIILLALSTMVFTTYMYQGWALTKAYFFKTVVGLFLIPLILRTDFKKYKWAVVYLGFIVVSCLLGPDPYLSFWGQYTKGEGVSGIIMLVLVALIIQNKFTASDIHFMDWTFAFLGVAFASFAMYQYGSNGHKLWVNSFASHSNMAGFVFALLIPFALAKSYLLVPFVLTGLYLTACRGGTIATGFVLLFWFVRNKFVRYALIASFILIYIVGRQLPIPSRYAEVFHYENTTRGFMMKDVAPLLKNPLGVSLGNFRMAFAPIKTKEFEERDPGSVWDNPHNIYLHSLAVFGWIPTIIYLLVLYCCLRSGIRHIRYATLAYMIAGFSSFDTMDTLPILWCIIGVGLMTSQSRLVRWL